MSLEQHARIWEREARIAAKRGKVERQAWCLTVAAEYLNWASLQRDFEGTAGAQARADQHLALARDLESRK